MKKRLRKKKHLGEFAVLGVSLNVHFIEGFDETAFQQFIDDFIDWIEAKDLQFGGGGSRNTEWSGVIDPGTQLRQIPSDALADLESWLRAREQVSDFKISPPWDLYHGRDPFDAEPI